MKKQVIYMNDWLSLHPYVKTSSADVYYTRLANEIYEILVPLLSEISYLTQEDLKRTGCCLAAYLEDRVSGVGIFRIFSLQHAKLYGTHLPFFATGKNYSPDGINVEDVRFLLWHYLEQDVFLYIREFLNPDAPFLETIAAQVYAVLERAFEEAPVNPEMNGAFFKEWDYSCFYEFRDVLKWVYYGSYLFNANLKEMQADWLKSAGENPQLDSDQLDQLEAERESSRIYNYPTPLLAYTTGEWLAALLGESHPYYTDVKRARRKNLALVCHPEGKDACRFIEYKSGRQIKVTGDIQDEMPQIKEKQILAGAWVEYRGIYWPEEDELTLMDKEDVETENPLFPLDSLEPAEKETARLYEDFVAATGGKPYKCFASIAAVREFLAGELRYASIDEIRFPAKESKDYVLNITSSGKIRIYPSIAVCIRDGENPFYDARQASRRSIALFTVPGLCGGELLKYLVAHCLVPDIPPMVYENLDFILRYFLRGEYCAAFEPDMAGGCEL